MVNFLVLLVSFTWLQLIFDSKWPFWRLSLFVLVPLYFCYKPKIDKSLKELSENKQWFKVIKIIALLLLTARVGQSIHKIVRKPKHFEDMAQVIVDAAHVVFRGKSPYSEPIDTYPVTINGVVKNYDGMKYSPYQVFLYGPFTQFLKVRGIYLGNFLAYFGMLLIVFLTLRKEQEFLAWVSVILYTSIDWHFTLAFNNGTNDFFPTIFILLAILMWRKGQTLKSGLLLGFSILCKQVPGGYFAFYFLLQKRWKEFLVASAVFWIGSAPFILMDWQEFFKNVLEFPLTRPSGPLSMSWPEYVSPNVRSVILLIGYFSFFTALLGNKWKLFHMKHSWFFPCWGTVFLILFMKMSPTHYFVWVTPFFVLWMLTPYEKENLHSIQ